MEGRCATVVGKRPLTSGGAIERGPRHNVTHWVRPETLCRRKATWYRFQPKLGPTSKEPRILRERGSKKNAEAPYHAGSSRGV